MPAPCQFAHHREYFESQSGVERRGRLVEQHDLGIERQRPGDGDALLLSAGAARRILLRLVAQTDAGQDLHGHVLGFPTGAAEDPFLRQADVAQDRHVRKTG